ncbi:DUF4440 domain-containing protein [Paenibacillus sp. J22TS3]|uniref:nuclear transport factor 2 family protein n=1 Tax=Paenibacillus sp. J22TS3 TaxID=2807192 RepID=UPI001B260DF2|nr:DUF4440 domain-containing protein [Paenibacillus sp. J22TS3]GIP24663.1 hypothetical protein J22TS3_49380 [Paenibacillus sp. J22TS3]
MGDLSSLEELILRLEKEVMSYDYDLMDQLLAEDFREFGSSGSIYNKRDQLDGALSKIGNEPIIYTVTDFRIKELVQDVVLATYRTFRHRDKAYALRSSIWKRNQEQWQMVFHQGTPVKE